MKTIGIFGGMGPEATFEFYGKIVRYTDAGKDQEHIPCIIFSNTQVPERTESILSGDNSIVKVLHDSVRLLEEAGADLIVIPCNTVHYWIGEMRSAVKIPIVDMIDETAKYVKAKGHEKIGLLGTTGTVRTGIYDKVFKAHGITVIKPENQEKVMEIIKRIKAGDTSESQRKAIEREIAKLRGTGSEIIVLGCTELPLLFRESMPDYVIDPMDILATKAIEMAGMEPKNIF